MMNKSMWFLLIVCLLFKGFLEVPLSAQDKRGLKVGGEQKITDKQGKEVILYKESHALVIGVSNYTDWPKLPGVQRDVEDVKTVLEAQGFNVVVKMNLNKNGLTQAFDEFINTYGLTPENRLVFYFAGHGHTRTKGYGDEMGYIVPADAPLPDDDETGFLAKAMDMQMINVYAIRIEAKHALFLFDSCFSGSIFALSRAVPEHITHKTAKPIRQFITSGSANEQVPDESIFCQQLIAALKGEGDKNEDGYVTGTELGMFLEDSVINYSHGAQHPQYGKIRNPKLDKGDFVFTLPAAPEEPTPIVPPEITGQFDDIEQQLQWQEYLKIMEEKFSTLSRYEASDFPTESKISGWERFLSTFSVDNPYSTRDEELRSSAAARVAFWKKSLLATPTPFPTATPVSVKPIPPPTATPLPPTPKPTATPEPAFRIIRIMIKDAEGNLIRPVEDVYTVRLGRTLTMTVDVTTAHPLEVLWTAFHGKVLPVSETTNTYTAQKSGSDIILIQVKDTQTGDTLEESIMINVVR